MLTRIFVLLVLLLTGCIRHGYKSDLKSPLTSCDQAEQSLLEGVSLVKVNEGLHEWCYKGIKCFLLQEKPPQAPDINVSLKEAGIAEYEFPGPHSLIPADDSPFANCIAYACRINRVPGITKDLWVNGKAVAKNVRNPFETFLHNFFTVVDARLLKKHGKLGVEKFQVGDLIAFRLPSGEFFHAGLVVPSPSSLGHGFWMQSKFGGDVTVKMSIGDTIKYYQKILGDVNISTVNSTVEVWRRSW